MQQIGKKQIQYCFECTDFPCVTLRTLDKRYTEKYRFSLVENLKYIQKNGIKEFLKYEQERRKCPTCGGVVCVHDKNVILAAKPNVHTELNRVDCSIVCNRPDGTECVSTLIRDDVVLDERSDSIAWE